ESIGVARQVVGMRIGRLVGAGADVKLARFGIVEPGPANLESITFQTVKRWIREHAQTVLGDITTRLGIQVRLGDKDAVAGLLPVVLAPGEDKRAIEDRLLSRGSSE